MEAELNLEEANVTNVLYTKLEGDNYRFDVTLIHDDDGEVKYADSWQVETLKGTLLGIRILTHAHGTVEFTRNGEITIPSIIDTIVVRGHDQTHDFGGQVMILSLLNSTKIFVNQGPSPLDFSTFVFQDYTYDISSSNDSQVDETSSSTILTADELSSPTILLNEPESETNNLNFNFINSGLMLVFLMILTRSILRQNKWFKH